MPRHDHDPPSPGSLILLNWEDPGIVALVVAADRFTDTDFMGRPYVWVSVPPEYHQGGVLQIPQSHIQEVLYAAH
jgi:hypothetical protein